MKTNQKAKSSSSSQASPLKREQGTRTSTRRNKGVRLSEVSSVFKTGVIAVVFMITGFETAVFTGKAAILKIQADKPQRNEKRVESFRFNPNTVSVADLQRLGFSEKQAQTIDNYRAKGGRFNRKSDFAKSFVVADSVYRRLEKYIEIPKTDINAADSAAFDALPGIGPYFAAAMVRYRERLGGYSCCEQLMEIYKFDKERFDALSDLIFCGNPAYLDLLSLSEDSLSHHPAILSRSTAHGIVLFRESNDSRQVTAKALYDAGVISSAQYEMLSRCTSSREN